MSLTNPSVLAFERKFDLSDAIFWQGSRKVDSKFSPVEIREKSVRGTISNRLSNKLKQAVAGDPAKLDAEIQKPNLQKVDVAALDHDNDLLKVEWSLKILPFNGEPSVCNVSDYQNKVVEVVHNYIKEISLAELCKRYASNIVNCRWLWRNRISAKSIALTVKVDADNSKREYCFEDARQYSLKTFDSDNSQISEIAQAIEAGLKGEKFIIITVSAEAEMGFGQQVYPSEELVLDKGNNSKKSKILYEIGGHAGMHSQKIGNAIRTIDDWYPKAKFPIAVEPYGAVTTMGAAFRQPKEKMDFYALLDDWILRDKQPDAEQKHFVMAVLIRGGVFGEGGKE